MSYGSTSRKTLISFISTLHDKSTANNVRKNIRNKLKIEQKHLSNRYSKINRMQLLFFRKWLNKMTKTKIRYEIKENYKVTNSSDDTLHEHISSQSYLGTKILNKMWFRNT